MQYVARILLAMFCSFQLVAGGGYDAHAAVVAGEFTYQKQGVSKTPFSYHVKGENVDGVSVWRISWQSQTMQAEFVVRRSDLRPLYTQRINHLNGQRIEIEYSSQIDLPTRYRRFEGGEMIERLIWHDALYDLGSVPQLLATKLANGDHHTITFSAINYSDGEVYQLKARRGEMRSVELGDEQVGCVAYTVSLDSWVSALVSPVHLLISQQQSPESNLIAYKGPGLDGVGSFWSLLLVKNSSRIALIDHKAVKVN